MTGFADPTLIQFDDVVRDEMRLYDIPAAALTITKDDRVVLSRGYGYSDGALSVPTAPNTLMRWASVDKMVTLTCIDYAIKNGLTFPSGAPLTRETRVLSTLQKEYGLKPPPGMEFAKGSDEITIGQLCEHKSGISDRGPVKLAGRLNARDAVSWRFCQPLKFPPGSNGAYSSNGFGLLRIILEWMTGDFIGFLRNKVFTSQEVAETRFRPQERDKREVFYWSVYTGQSPFPDDKGSLIPIPDGGGMFAEDGPFGWFSASAGAMASYLCNYYVTTADPYWVHDPATGARRLSHDNGYNEFVGSDTGTYSWIIQNRWFRYNLAFVCSRRAERQVENHKSLIERLHGALKQAGWD